MHKRHAILMFAIAIPDNDNINMSMLSPNRTKNRYIFEENIYFNATQICELLKISRSCLSRQLKSVLDIPGCLSARFRADYHGERYKKYRRTKLTHYNLNTVVAIAYRINNAACKKFLDGYHRVINGLHIRLAGTNYYIPSSLSPGEFLYYANRNCPPYLLDFEN